MGRAPCCDKANVKKGPWSPEEDEKLKDYIHKHGIGGNWISLPQKAGLKRCGKSCRLRWLNYLRPNIKHGEFSDDEDRIICTLFATVGSRWSIIAAQLPGRTDNDIKNYWNTKLKKKLLASPSPSSNLLYNCRNNTYYQTPSKSFSDFEASYLTPASVFLQPQESFQLQMFGGEAAASASCTTSSSDGSYCSSNQMNSYFSNDADENYQKLMIMATNEKPTNGLLWGESETEPLDYGFEEIKHLISSTSSCSDSFPFYENKAEEKVEFYY